MQNNNVNEVEVLKQQVQVLTQELDSSKKKNQQQEKEMVQVKGYYSPIIEKKMESNLSMQIAQYFAQSTLVPQAYMHNQSNCFIAIDMANRLHASPLQVMQSLNIVSGNLGWSGQFIIAVINQSGRYKAPLNFKVSGTWGKDYQCVAYANYKDGTLHESIPVTYQMAKIEGWLDKKGSKWQTMPELMARYRSASFFGKMFCPDLLLGLQSSDELKDSIDAEVVDISTPKTTAENKNKNLDEVAKYQKENTEVIKVDEETGEIKNSQAQYSTPTSNSIPTQDTDDWMK